MPTTSNGDIAQHPASARNDAGQAVEQNRLLRALPAEDYALLAPHMERVQVPLLEVLAEPNTPFTHVMFPQTGVISVVNRVTGGGLVEVGTIGNEGMAGLSVILDAESVPSVTLMEIPGTIVRIPAPLFARLTDERPAIRRLVNRYTQAFLIQVAQTASCNRAHEIAERCARWICMAHDRMCGAPQFQLTQEVLAQMLGVRRAGVTVAAGTLQRAGLIRYSRGKITVVDREKLEAASCECYGIVQAHFDRLIGASSAGPSPSPSLAV